MNISKTLLYLLFSFLFSGCIATKNQPPDSVLLPTTLQPIGRYIIDGNNLQMISSGMHFGFTFEGAQCTVYAASPAQHNYIQYALDGIYQKRIRIEKGSYQPIVIQAKGDGMHTIWLYKATEAHTGAVHIEKIEGNNIKPVPVAKKILIEFIGNSITCGAAADPSEIPCGTGAYHDQHNAYMAYGPRVARALGTHFILSSVSGIGIYRNWNSDGPAMPQVFEKADFQHDSQKLWDFKKFDPAIVSIALGTNDFSNGDGKRARLPFDSAVFVNHYIQFVQQVKAKYPASKIVLLSSPMVHGNRGVLLQNCLLVVKAKVDAASPKAVPIAVYFFKPMQARGCSGHPNVEDHAVLANELIPFFKKLL